MAAQTRPLHGWINLNKPLGMTSNAALSRVKRLLHPARIGFAGTLDPLASGVLPLALGDATRLVDFVTGARKLYMAHLCWGMATETDDAAGQIIAYGGAIPGDAAIDAMLPRFTGKRHQSPPLYSAIRHFGQRAYRLARAGKPVPDKPRQVTVHALYHLGKTHRDVSLFEIECAKGTYIRALVRDLARALGTAGHLIALRRIRVGQFDETKMISLETLEEIMHAQKTPADAMAASQFVLRPLQFGVADLPVIDVDAQMARLLSHGQSLCVDKWKIHASSPQGGISWRVGAYSGGIPQSGDQPGMDDPTGADDGLVTGEPAKADEGQPANVFFVRHHTQPVAICTLQNGRLKPRPVFGQVNVSGQGDDRTA